MGYRRSRDALAFTKEHLVQKKGKEVKMRYRLKRALIVALGLIAAWQVHAQTFFSKDATIDYPIPDTNGVVVGYDDYFDWQNQQNGTDAVVQIVGGAELEGVGAYSSSQVVDLPPLIIPTPT
jgi:hypothetical protein